MKLALLAPFFEPYVDDGHGHSTPAMMSLLARELRALGVVVELVALRGSRSDSFDAVHGVPGSPSGNVLLQGSSCGGGGALQRAVEFVVDGLERGRWDAAVGFAFDVEAIGAQHERLLHVLTFHRGLNARVDELIVGRGRDDLIFLSRAQARAFGHWPDVVLGCPVDVDLVLSVRSLSRGDGAHRVLFAGRICEDKGADVALRLGEELGVEIDFVGKAQDPALVRAIEASAHACYLGELPRLELYALMASRSCLLQVQRPSWQEAFGLVTAEALCSGLPVVALRTGANAELVQAGDGVVVDDIRDLGPAIELVRAWSPIRRAAIARHAQQRFGPRECAQRLVARLRAHVQAPTTSV